MQPDKNNPFSISGTNFQLKIQEVCPHHLQLLQEAESLILLQQQLKLSGIAPSKAQSKRLEKFKHNETIRDAEMRIVALVLATSPENIPAIEGVSRRKLLAKSLRAMPAIAGERAPLMLSFLQEQILFGLQTYTEYI